VNPHPGLGQPLREARGLGVGGGRDLLREAPVIVFLEDVVVPGMRVGLEMVWPDEDDRAWRLNR
jgi:hypothetical protein